MKIITAIFSLVLLLSITTFSEEISKNDKITGAVTSIHNWLGIVDSGSYSESWSLTGKMFQDQISDSKWTKALDKTLKPLGKMISRKLKSSKYKKSLPGAPNGEYVVVQFKTKFENKKKAIETVTVTFEEKKWKVVGYYIK